MRPSELWHFFLIMKVKDQPGCVINPSPIFWEKNKRKTEKVTLKITETAEITIKEVVSIHISYKILQKSLSINFINGFLFIFGLLKT